jgi:hypothetical protein
LQIHWDFKLSPAKYAQQGRDSIIFPLLLHCPACHAYVRLYRHGFYVRNVLTHCSEYRIVICRYLCRSCRVTISLLPSFLSPRFQRCQISILEALKGFFVSGNKGFYRQIMTFYIKRFRQNMLALILGFREGGLMLKIPSDENEKAIKLIELLLDTLAGDPNSTESQDQLNFMALTL